MAERGCEVVGIEIDPDAAGAAEAWADRVVVGNIDEGDVWNYVKDESFDVVVLGDVLEHLRDPLDSLRQAVRKLKPSGYVVTSLPNVAHGDVRLSLLLGRFRYADKGLLDRTHVRFFTAESSRQLHTDAGLCVVETKRVIMPLFQSEIGVRREEVDDRIVDQVLTDPEAETYQFVTKSVRDNGTQALAQLSDRVNELSDHVHSKRPHGLAAHADYATASPVSSTTSRTWRRPCGSPRARCRGGGELPSGPRDEEHAAHGPAQVAAHQARANSKTLSLKDRRSLTSFRTQHVEGEAQRPHVLAFYLPQFHPVPENDAWHGNGFTEWSVVARARPLFPGHRQPDLPGELGFYDLRVPETRYLQARLAREHGISGFLYYHYWFSGKRMLGRPFDEVRASGQPDFPFALCWANESWYRRWQSSTDEMLVEQEFSEEDDLEHIRWLIQCFKDPRYIRIAGRPLLAVYRVEVLPNPTRTVELWRRECAAAGEEAPWLVMFETSTDTRPPSAFGFDASAEFVPHLLSTFLDPLAGSGGDGSTEYDYDAVASGYLNRPTVAWPRYPCVATGWDNTPRRPGGDATILRDRTPERYGSWLREATMRQARSAGRDGIVFVNAWNEWAEGAHLEPDDFSGRAYLETTRDVLCELFGTDVIPSPGPERAPLLPTTAEDLYHDLYRQFVALQRSRSGLLSYSDRRLSRLRAHYETLLAQSRRETLEVADLNQELAEQVALQARLLEDLGVHDAPAPGWLAGDEDGAVRWSGSAPGG